MRFTAFMISEDGTKVQYSAEAENRQTMRFDSKQRILETKIAEDEETALKKGTAAGLSAPVLKAPGLDIKDWEDTLHPKVNGHPLELAANEESRCIAILPDQKRFLLGGDFNLRLFDATGKQEWEGSMPAAVWHVNVSKDGKTGAVLLGDGTVRWFSIKDGSLLLSLFIQNDQKQWVAWTRTGYYDAAAGSEDIIGWHINRGKEQAADFFPVSRFRSTFNRPDVVERAIPAGGETEALRLADLERGRKTEVVDVNKSLPPLVTIKSPENNVEVSTPTLKVEFAVRTPADARSWEYVRSWTVARWEPRNGFKKWRIRPVPKPCNRSILLCRPTIAN